MQRSNFFSSKWQTAWHLACVHSKYVGMADMWATPHLQRRCRTVLPRNILDGPLVKMHRLTYVYPVLIPWPSLTVLIIALSSQKCRWTQCKVQWKEKEKYCEILHSVWQIKITVACLMYRMHMSNHTQTSDSFRLGFHKHNRTDWRRMALLAAFMWVGSLGGMNCCCNQIWTAATKKLNQSQNQPGVSSMESK